MPKDVTLLLLAQDHTDTDWSTQMSKSIPDLHQSLKGGKRMVICVENGDRVTAEGMMTYNAQMVAEIRVSQAAKKMNEKTIAPGEFQKRVEDYMRKDLKVEPEKKPFQPYLSPNGLDTFLKNPNANLPVGFHGREDAYLAELELFRHAHTNKIPVVGVDTGRGALAHSGVAITEDVVASVEYSRIEAMSQNTLTEMRKLSDSDGGVVVMVNLGRAHMTSLETMVNERVQASRMTDLLKVKTLAGVKEGEQTGPLKDILYSSPVDIQNTAIAEMKKAAKTLLGESGNVSFHLDSQNTEFAKGVLATCDSPLVEMQRINRELNEVLDQTLDSLGVDANARKEMNLTTASMKLAFVKAVKDSTDPRDEFTSVSASMKKLDGENSQELWGGKTAEQLEDLMKSDYDAYEKLELSYHVTRNAIEKHLGTTSKSVAPNGKMTFEALKGNLEKAEKLESLSNAGAVLSHHSEVDRQKLADQIESSLQKIDFSNRVIRNVDNLASNQNCKLLPSRDGALIKKEVLSVTPRVTVGESLQKERASLKPSEVDVKVELKPGGAGAFKFK